MRISDWSSDVCSSDLDASTITATTAANPRAGRTSNGLRTGRAVPAFPWARRASGTAHRTATRAAGAMTKANMGKADVARIAVSSRSEEHTSELQSLMRISYAVFCLKKKIDRKKQVTT